jgi:hypothetical protein
MSAHLTEYPDEKKEHELDHVEGHATSEQAMIEQAMLRGEEETKLGFKAVVKLHYPAAMWSMLLSYVAESRPLPLV